MSPRTWFETATARRRARERGILYPLAVFLAAIPVTLAQHSAQAQPVLLVCDGQLNRVGEYDAVTGATINANFVGPAQGLNSPRAMALDSSNHLFVASFDQNGFVGEYDATTGATINANFISGLSYSRSLAVDGSNRLFVTRAGGVNVYNATTGALINGNFINTGSPYVPYLVLDGHNHLFLENSSSVGEYDATTGATINANFIGNLGSAMALDGLNHLFLQEGGPGEVGEYDATTGAAINANFIPFNGTLALGYLALDGNNHLFASQGNRTVGQYDATTGAALNVSFITFTGDPEGLVLTTAVPEPSTFALQVLGLGGLAAWGWRSKRRAKAELPSRCRGTRPRRSGGPKLTS